LPLHKPKHANTRNGADGELGRKCKWNIQSACSTCKVVPRIFSLRQD
jgi:hypothetical protein